MYSTRCALLTSMLSLALFVSGCIEEGKDPNDQRNAELERAQEIADAFVFSANRVRDEVASNPRVGLGKSVDPRYLGEWDDDDYKSLGIAVAPIFNTRAPSKSKDAITYGEWKKVPSK